MRDSDRGECDFVKEVSAPLPIAVIAWLLGVPESDWKLLFDWTNRTIGAGDPEYQEPGKTPQETAMAAMTELFMYFTKLVEEKKKKPADDLVTLFAQPRSRRQAAAADGRADLLPDHRDRRQRDHAQRHHRRHARVRRAPGRAAQAPAQSALLESAVEEVVRWSSPIIHFGAHRPSDFELRGKRISRATRSALFYPSANRDEEVFPDGDVFRIDRDPNHHLGFGVGEHFCLGSHLARLEMAVAYKHLLPRIEEIELAGPIERLHSAWSAA